MNLSSPSAAAIRLDDISIGLATTNRFRGQTASRSSKAGAPYSVAQHSVVVAQLALKHGHGDPLIALQALLHDAHEAYTGDITTPLKLALGDAVEALNLIQHSLDIVIHQALGVPMPGRFAADIIAFCDATALATEWRDMMPGTCPNTVLPATFSIRPLQWARAEQKFLEMFDRLALAAGVAMPKFNPVPAGILK